jgi:hypothetical protein
MSRAQLTSTTQQDSGGAVAPFLAGKNKIINGDFRINQRNFTSATSGYCFDRWTMAASGGTMTVTPQTFTPGAAPVAGYEAQNYAQIVTSGYGSSGDYGLFIQNIEDMRTFAGQTITVSFWAKAASGTPKIAVETYLGLGSGGSGGTLSTPGGAVTISTSWGRYSLTFTVPSISGATIGTGSSIAVNLWVSAGSSFNTRASSIGTQNNTFSIWGVQAENGSVATPFTTASGTLQGELALCQRYYYRVQSASAGTWISLLGFANSSSAVFFPVPIKSSMRILPTSVDYSSVRVFDGYNSAVVANTVTIDGGTPEVVVCKADTGSGLTQFRPYYLFSNTLPSYIGLSAEL